MPIKNTGTPMGVPRGARLRLKKVKEKKFVRAREPVRPTSGKVSGYFPSFKNGRSIAWESQLEKKACYFFEFSPLVKAFYEQPITVNYSLNRASTPDFKLEMINGQNIYVEIKPFNKLENPEILDKYCKISEFWSQEGFQYIIVTDRELNNHARYENLNFLRPHLRSQVCPKSLELISHLLTENESCALELATAQVKSLNKVYTLIAHGELMCDLDKKIVPTSQIKIPKEKYNEISIITFRTTPNLELNTFYYQSDS